MGLTPRKTKGIIWPEEFPDPHRTGHTSPGRTSGNCPVADALDQYTRSDNRLAPDTQFVTPLVSLILSAFAFLLLGSSQNRLQSNIT